MPIGKNADIDSLSGETIGEIRAPCEAAPRPPPHSGLLGYSYGPFVILGFAGLAAEVGQAAVPLILVRSGASLAASADSFDAEVGPFSLSGTRPTSLATRRPIVNLRCAWSCEGSA
jgi:hypothetical protein